MKQIFKWRFSMLIVVSVLAFTYVENNTVAARNPASPPSNAPFDARKTNNSSEISAFISRLSAEENIDWNLLQSLISRAKWSQKSLNLTQPRKPKDPSQKTAKRIRDWPKYRRRFLTTHHLNAGVAFLLNHKNVFMRVEQEFGVPASIIASILNIESRYGKQTGRYKALDALTTLAFYHETRRSFFQQELAGMIRLWRKGLVDIFKANSSYAGAMGMGQFMPSSAEAYAVDYDGDGVIRLENPEDAIGSVANFLRSHGWNRTEQLDSILRESNIDLYEKQLPINTWLKEGPKPTISKDMIIKIFENQVFTNDNKATVSLKRAIKPLKEPLSLIDLPSPNGTKYRLGAPNYYVITRYNRSFDYATAVFDLARALECAVAKRAPIYSNSLYSCLT